MKNLMTFLMSVLSFSALAQPSLKGFGDSNTDYWIDLPQTQKWLHLVGQELNLSVTNYASAGATIYTTNGLVNQKNNASTGSKDYATFMFGTNDAYQQLISPQWKADYKLYIQHFISEGYDPNKLFIISPNYDPGDVADAHYLPQVALAKQYVNEIANELAIKYVDLYGEMKMMFDAFADPRLSLSVYAKPNWMIIGGKHLTHHGHRLLADIFKKKFNPPTYISGQYRVKLFGAGSAMAGISSYHHSFVELYGNKTARHPKNFAIAGTGVLATFPGDTAQLDVQKNRASDGVKDIAIFLYGNNDGNGTLAWKNNYKTQIQDVIDAGYFKENIVIMTVTRAPNLEINNPTDWTRIGAANDRIREIAQELNIRLLDLDQMSLPFADDYHISDAGNEIVASALQSVLTTPLPVKFSLFNSQCFNGTVKLVWKTASEYNSSRFDIENSVDGRTWNIIGTKDAAGISTTENTYSFQTTKTGFFRIVEHDIDGKKTISSILKSSCNIKDEQFTVFPNPVRDIVTVNISVNEHTQTSLFVRDAKGAVVKKVPVSLLPGINQVQINFGDLPKGSYTLNSTITNQTIKLIKQ